jgi:hypothetical protein
MEFTYRISEAEYLSEEMPKLKGTSSGLLKKHSLFTACM